VFLEKAKQDYLDWQFVHEPFLFFIVSFVVSSGFPAILDYFRVDVFRVKKSRKLYVMQQQWTQGMGSFGF
jgi:hypothetical protein